MKNVFEKRLGDDSDSPLEKRNKRIITLVEGDILKAGDMLEHVTEGEIHVYADGTVDDKEGILAEVSREEVGFAIARGSVICNLEDIG